MNRQIEIQHRLLELLEDILLFLVAWQWLPGFVDALKRLLWFMYDLVVL